MAQQKLDYNIIIIGGLLVGGYFVLKPILEKLGLKDSAEDKETAKALEEQESKYNIWAGTISLKKAAGTRKNISVLTAQGGDYYAKQINNAFGIINDNEQQIFGAFRNLRYKTQVASIVDAFYRLYKKDLLTTLKSKLSDSELNEIIKIIETKPLGITNK